MRAKILVRYLTYHSESALYSLLCEGVVNATHFSALVSVALTTTNGLAVSIFGSPEFFLDGHQIFKKSSTTKHHQPVANRSAGSSRRSKRPLDRSLTPELRRPSVDICFSPALSPEDVSNNTLLYVASAPVTLSSRSIWSVDRLGILQMDYKFFCFASPLWSSLPFAQ